MIHVTFGSAIQHKTHKNKLLRARTDNLKDKTLNDESKIFQMKHSYNFHEHTLITLVKHSYNPREALTNTLL